MSPVKADLDAVVRAAAKREKAEREWRMAIVSASDEGHSLRAIAQVAGVTHTRVHQIVNSVEEWTPAD